MSDLEDITDLTRGVYRRQYAGFVGGKRINRLTLEAEAWFWRVHAAADDFGNLVGDASLLYTATAGRRAGLISIDRVQELINEAIEAGLLRSYQSGTETYLHVVGFGVLQPAGKNGKRVRRVPASPWDGGGNGTTDPQGADAAGTKIKWPAKARVSKANGESGGIPVNPELPSATHSDSDSDTDPHAHPAAQAAGATAAASRPAASASETVLTFPCNGVPNTWALTRDLADELIGLFPGLYYDGEFRAALANVLAGNKKTARGMRRFLTDWLQRSQNNPRMRAKPTTSNAIDVPVPTTRAARRAAEIDEVLK